VKQRLLCFTFFQHECSVAPGSTIVGNGPASRLRERLHFCQINFRLGCEKDRLYNPDGQENVLFAAWKRIVSGRARNAPFLPLNYRDARTVMIQNVNGIKSNDTQAFFESY
jgi:hypothetical protein